MNRFRNFLADLTLIPAMWRFLVAEVRGQQAFHAQLQAWQANPDTLARRTAIAGRIQGRTS